MKIRRATPADQAELNRLLNIFYEYSQTTLPANQAAARALKNPRQTLADTIANLISNPENIVFVADTGDKLVGYICGQIKDKPQRIQNREGYIEHWFMEADQRHHGLGKQLLDALIKDFKAADCTHLGVDTHLDNHDAVATYEHLDFTKRLVTFFKVL